MQTILNVPECEFREYAKDHTPIEIAQHFGKNQTTVRVVLSQKHIPHKERILLKNDNNKCSPKRTGLTVDMIRTLGEFYSYNSIAKVFNVSHEWVRQICEKEKEAC